MTKRAHSSLRDRWSVKGTVAEFLGKTWVEPAIPLIIVVVIICYFSIVVPSFASVDSTSDMARQLAEFVFLTVGMGVVLISGGIDLSVGAVYGLCNFTALTLLIILQLPAVLVILGTLVVGAFLGAINGYLVAYLRGRPFLTTLVMFLVLEAVLRIVIVRYSPQLAVSAPDDLLWTIMGKGAVAGIPTAAAVLLIVLVLGHIVLSRARPGRHLTAVGSSRRAARHAGIKAKRVIMSTYVISGMCAASAGFFTAARLNSASAEMISGMQYSVLAAAVIGGISLSGGVGTVWRMLIGGALVFVLNYGLLQLGFPGSVYDFMLAVVLLLAVGLDRKWAKHRANTIQKIYINPTTVTYGELPDIRPGTGSVYAMNNKLSNAEAIGLGKVEGPEDVILDNQGRLYCGDRRGRYLRFSGPNFEHDEVFTRTGGFPLGLAWDFEGNLLCCVGGMGLYSVDATGKPSKVTDETNRTWYKLRDDARLRLTDDLDIVPDGRIYFSEATERFEAHDWILDGLEGRPNGRVVCYNPATGRTHTEIPNLVFPNGICGTHDGEAILIGQTWLCRVLRYWHSGEKKGQLEIFADDLPGYVDNINRASDGTYWVALNGLRSPAFDLALRKPAFRRRMIKQIPRDEWLYPSMDYGCVIKMTPHGEVTESLWDPGAQSHSSITSMREYEGHLYLGGLENNRVGRIKLPEQSTYCRCGQPPCHGSRETADRPAHAVSTVGASAGENE
jgi:ribose transport system permease protein